MLPFLIAKLNLSIAEAGWLAAILVISSSFAQPLYGYISDRYLKRAFVVFSPLVTAVFMSCLGLANSYAMLALLLVCGGVGIASFHPQGAAMTALASRNRKGLGMSIFVTSGTIGYSLGPLLITYTVPLVRAGALLFCYDPRAGGVRNAFLPGPGDGSLLESRCPTGLAPIFGRGVAAVVSALHSGGHSLGRADVFRELPSTLLISEGTASADGRQSDNAVSVFRSSRGIQRRDAGRQVWRKECDFVFHAFLHAT